jgi:hypothetical protein
MLSKLATHADSAGGDRRQQADEQLRDQVRSLITGWTLDDPNPEVYGAALQGMAMARATSAPAAAPAADSEDPERLIKMAIEVSVIRGPVWRAIDRLVDTGRTGALLGVLREAPTQSTVGELIWERVATPAVIGKLCAAQPPDFRSLDELLPRLDAAALEPLIETLITSDSRAIRRGLLDRLSRVAERVTESIVRNLGDERWYVKRNMLVLLDNVPQLPDQVAPARHAQHADARVRREALKLRLKLPAERDEAITLGIRDADDQVARLALMAAQQHCPISAVGPIAARLAAPSSDAELRVLAIRALGRSGSPEALRLLLSFTDGGKTWFGRPRLRAKTPELVAALLALSMGWARDPRARAIIELAARAHDPEIRAAAGTAR